MRTSTDQKPTSVMLAAEEQQSCTYNDLKSLWKQVLETWGRLYIPPVQALWINKPTNPLNLHVVSKTNPTTSSTSGINFEERSNEQNVKVNRKGLHY